MAARNDREWIHSWGPYWFPMLTFLVIVSVARQLPESLAGWMLLLQVLAPGALLFYYVRQGRYPELRGGPKEPSGSVLDVVVGLLGAAIWVVPFVVWPSLGPDAPGVIAEKFGGFPVGLVLSIRAFGFVVITPFIEELFVRSWLMRYIQVFEKRTDFRYEAIARFTWPSFLVVLVYFVFSHEQWEWGVMFGWSLLTMAWFYHRRRIRPLILVHGVTNGAVMLFVTLFDGRITGSDGTPIALWFFL